MIERFPRYVWFKGTVLARRSNENGNFRDYWCYNGNWGIDAFVEARYYGEYNIISKECDIFPENVRLREASESDWIAQVGTYVPMGYEFEDGTCYGGDKSYGKRYRYARDFEDVDDDSGYRLINACGEIKIGDMELGAALASSDNNRLMYLLIR